VRAQRRVWRVAELRIRRGAESRCGGAAERDARLRDPEGAWRRRHPGGDTRTTQEFNSSQNNQEGSYGAFPKVNKPVARRLPRAMKIGSTKSNISQIDFFLT